MNVLYIFNKNYLFGPISDLGPFVRPYVLFLSHLKSCNLSHRVGSHVRTHSPENFGICGNLF